MEIEQVRKIRLLLVDDETQFLNTLTKRLHKRGLIAHQAGSAESCLDILENSPMDVVVMDVKMPGMSGIDALVQIKKKYRKTEVILLTGHSDIHDGVKGIKAGAFDYLSKPVVFEHLLGKIVQAYERILGQKQEQEAFAFRARMEKQMIATERLAALGTLAAGVAHEINNPLAIINESAGYLSQLLKKAELADMPRKMVFEKMLQKIQASVERARIITHDLLESVRKSESVLAEVHMAELVSETMELFQKEVRDKAITMELQVIDELNTIWVDPNKVRQILINLTSNAIHATPSGGWIAIRLKKITGGISLTIADTGTGIPKQNLDKIFEPFFSTKDPGMGTGLGLFVTKEIVNKLGGTIEVTSRIAQGTKFRVNILDQGRKREDKSLDVNDTN